MKQSFVNRFFYDPAGWVSDVCAGASQRPCVPQYFNNYKDVGYRLSVVLSDFTGFNNPIKVNFEKPFQLICPYNPNVPVMAARNYDNAAVWPWTSPNIIAPADGLMWADTMTKLFQEMQECTVNNESVGGTIGSSIDGAVGYNKSLGGLNFNYYFNNYTSDGNVDNKNAFITPPRMLYDFWQWAAASTLQSYDINTNYLPKFLEYMVKQSDLRLWGTPGLYTIDPTNGAQWVQNGLRPMIGALGAPGFFIIEQKSIE